MTLGERVRGLFEQLHVPVFRYLLRKTRDSGRAEEITQETFLRLFRHLRENRLLDNPKAWVFTVANNLAIDASRDESHIKDLDETSWRNIEESRFAGGNSFRQVSSGSVLPFERLSNPCPSAS
jgi:DNA-directed RNA polymerase specialized sigma24 family protein